MACRRFVGRTAYRVALVLLAGCGNEATATRDAATVPRADATADTAPVRHSDATADTAPGSRADATADTAPAVTGDAGADADAATVLHRDATVDATVIPAGDATADAATVVVPDANVDAPTDVGTDAAVVPDATHACAAGTTSCPATCGGSAGSDACVDPLTDAQNCGACGVQCAGWSCQDGTCQDPSNGSLSAMLVDARPDWLFWVRDNGEPPSTGTTLATAAITFDLGATTLAGVNGKSIQTIAEWDYSCLRIPNGSTDGSGLPRSTFPCFDSLQGCSAPTSDADALARLQAYYQARLAALPGNSKILSTTGHFFFQHYGAEWGADLIQSEVGENINSTQAHIAFSRGAARQYGKPWGLDMSSWYGPGNRDWTVPGIWGTSSCSTCGHSLSLSERTYFAAYMVGANFMEDEGGSFNFFLGNTAPLQESPLGQMAQTINQFATEYADRGTTYVPIAILMDHDHGMGLGWWETSLTWDTFPLDTSRLFTKNLYQTIWPQSFSVGWSLPGANESQYMVPSPFGDSFDVLLENAPASLFSSYRAIIATGDLANSATLLASLGSYVNAGGILVLDSTAPAAPYVSGIVGAGAPEPLGTLTTSQAVQYKVGAGFVVVINDMTQWNHVLAIVSNATSPFTISGSAEFMFNQRGPSWVVTLINDLGVTKIPLTEEVTDPQMAQTITVQAKLGSISGVVPWRGATPTQTQSSGFVVSVAAGDIGVYQFDTSCVSPPALGPLLTEP